MDEAIFTPYSGIMFVVTVTFALHEGFEQAFLARVQRQASDSLELEPDCLRFDVATDPDNPKRIFLYEIYRDAAAFTGHLASDHFRAFDGEVAEMIDEKTVETWLMAGD